MSTSPVADRINQYFPTVETYLRFESDLHSTRHKAHEKLSDFITGNPQEMPSMDLTNVLQQHAVPQNKDWFAYKRSEPDSQVTVARSLKEWKGLDIDPEDVAMTNGGFAAIQLALHAVVNPGDEVIMMTPLWFCYELLITSAGGIAVRVPVKAKTFDLDLKAIEAAITPRTRAILLNTPHNPTGKIYSKETLTKLSDILSRASEKNNRTIYLLSDEAFSRIVFDGNEFISPATIYPNTFLLYTYGKTLLAPGQRLGYIALPRTMPAREMVRQAVIISQIASGYSFPNALLQHGLSDIDKLSIDVEQLQYRRDWIVRELSAMGYSIHAPDGTFFLFPESPIPDDWEFVNKLHEYNILVMPGTVAEMPGYFRMALTANDEMIERALPGFEKAIS